MAEVCGCPVRPAAPAAAGLVTVACLPVPASRKAPLRGSIAAAFRGLCCVCVCVARSTCAGTLRDVTLECVKVTQVDTTQRNATAAAAAGCESEAQVRGATKSTQRQQQLC